MTETETDKLLLLRNSPFFEAFEEKYLIRLADHAKLVDFIAGEHMFKEGDRAEALYALIEGEVSLAFEPRRAQSGVKHGAEALIRKIVETGRPIGWSSLVKPYKYRATATATKPTRLLEFQGSFLRDFCKVDLEFGMLLMKQILWVIGNRLRATRVRLVSRRYDREVMAIRALLDQSAESLSVTSPLHKIPIYLENRLTIQDAFECLEVLKDTGEPRERNVANLCLEVLESVKKELSLFKDQQAIYDAVASAPEEQASEQTRNTCSKLFVSMFEKTDYVIKGLDHLPKTSGNVFIMNHLLNHPGNLLPNDFQLTLDTHFVSSMILYKHYGKAPVRIVRKSGPEEFRHQGYYDKLGYIYVYPGRPDKDDRLPHPTRKEMREQFFESAEACFKNEDNLVICPEGTSVSTKDSPAPFKAGVFRLALRVKPEPLIVPIAVANFDKRLTHTKTAAVIQPPFKLSEKIPRDCDDQTLFDFVNSYCRQYKEYVEQAIRLAEQ